MTIPQLLRRCLLGAAAALLAAHASAATISLSTTAAQYTVGQTVTVQFRIAGLTGAPGDSLSGFDMDVLYDTSVLQATSFAFINPASGRNELDLPEAGSFGFLGDATPQAGRLDAFGVSGNSAGALDAGQPDDFVFLTLSFQALAAGDTAIALDLNDPNLLFTNSDADPLAVDVGTGRVAFAIAPGGSTQVPEPGSIALLLIGAGAMAFAGRRRARAAAGTAALALAATVLPAAAQQPVPAQQAQSAAPAPKAVTGTILAVQGKRAQVKLSSGAVEWVAVHGNIAPDQVGKRISGTVAKKGDLLVLTDPVIAN